MTKSKLPQLMFPHSMIGASFVIGHWDFVISKGSLG
jgi:hypothetical protein